MISVKAYKPGSATTQTQDLINNPSHYKAGNLESIDIIEAFELNFRLGNAIKYILRAGRKTPDALVDLKKAQWYLNREISKLEKP